MRLISLIALSVAAFSVCASPASDTVTEEVIVKGTRPEVEKRVNAFVKGVVPRRYSGSGRLPVKSLVRWSEPICPLIAGVPAQQGEFMLQRISQAVRDAGAPLAAADCKPNFHVVLTTEPDELLDLWRQRAPRLYGGESVAKVRRILGKPRPVRAWYNVRGGCGAGVDTGPIVKADANFGLQVSTPYGGGCLKDSNLAFSTVDVISSVIVVVDLDDTKTTRLGPLTDYISMIGLTDVYLDGEWADEPTILRLFAASGDASLQKLSLWDRAFLKALYGTSQTDRHQRGEVARSMVNDFMGR